MMEKTLDFYEVYDYYYIPVWQKTWFIVSICCLCALLLAGILFFLLRKRIKKPLSAWEQALHDLRLLSPTTYTTKDEYKQFYFQITVIIKRYLHQRFGWNIYDKTDSELLQYLVDRKFDPGVIELLKKIAQEALWIKFANVEALKTQAEEDLRLTILLIENTKPQQ